MHLPDAWTLDAETLSTATMLRRALHSAPELSGIETATAEVLAERLRTLGATVVTALGGTGVAAVFGTGVRGLLIRCELDALPILETRPARMAIKDRRRGASLRP